ncbi:hypothetical protein IFO69_06085 [Echinicola sp. CAU 1574]|uniref:Outer membrane protein beta-barrel domain-containing protein n=1 Tax=Echinicola arenosa TaxID=2774144 RepID=A0ABR9AHI2_9BACT|nr:hypothetical protein [Echinicola arenosa]MBD8488310.1 hypothetical protein [Echinicola arenosa]
MKEQFDKRLVEKIKDSFQDHEEVFDPVQWDKFSKAYFNKPVKRRKMVFWPFVASGIAASLLLVFLFYPYEKEIEQGVSTLKDTIASKSESLDNILKPAAPLSLDKKEDRGISDPKAPRSDESKETITAFPNQTIERENYESIQTGKLARLDQRIALVDESTSLKLPKMVFGEEGQAGLINVKGNTNQASTVAVMKTEEAQAWIEEWKNEGLEKDATTGSSTIIKRDKPLNPFRLGVVAGPQTVSNPVDGMKFGGGVMSEFSINDKLKIDVGVTYAHQSIEPGSNSKLPADMTLRAANSLSESSSFATNNYLGSEYTFSYAGLDIPVNLKYKVMDKDKADLFLITGLSSMVYFDQTGKETFQVESMFSSDMAGNLQFQESVQEYTQEYSPESSQSNVDLGKMLNISFGYEYNLKNGTYLSIEPYYKLPLGDMTFTNQQFSVGGLNLRMNFQFKK